MVAPPSIGNSPTERILDATARTAWLVGGISLVFAIVLGAFGAHAIGAALPADRLAAYETASQYHFYSCFFLFAIALTRPLVRAPSALKQLLRRPKSCGAGARCYFVRAYISRAYAD